jgi:hypothetical protein
VSFWSLLGTQLWNSWTYVLVAGYVITHLLAKSAPRPVEAYHLRFALSLVIGHVAALTIGVAQEAYEYHGGLARIDSIAYQAIANLSLG